MPSTCIAVRLEEKTVDMNDPHVVALRFRVHHHDRVDYGRAGPLVFEALEFIVEVKDQSARFEFKQHYASEEDARRVVEPFIQNWEFDSSLRRDPDCFRLEFEGAEIIDRRPSPGVVHGMAMPAKFTFSISPAKGTAYARTYPLPPSGIDSAHRSVQVFFHRYARYKAGKKLLTSFAYYCYTEIAQVKKGQTVAIFVSRRAALDRVERGEPDELREGLDAFPFRIVETDRARRALFRLAGFRRRHDRLIAVHVIPPVMQFREIAASSMRPRPVFRALQSEIPVRAPAAIG